MNYAEFWGSRSERERRVIFTCGGLLALLLVFALVWLPLERTRSNLSLSLPQLRASIEQLKRDADEVKRLKAIAPTVTGKPAPLVTLATQNTLTGAQVSVPDDRHVHVVASDVGFTRLLDWLVSVQSTHALRVESARIEALPMTGRVRADLTLTRS
ncbi:MAG TPA: type II secretion system protein GspM [Usitatibacter sp.]|jgi:general secretion pathway protein M